MYLENHILKTISRKFLNERNIQDIRGVTLKDVTKNKQATRQSNASEMTKASKQEPKTNGATLCTVMSSPHPQAKICWLS